MIAVTWLLIAVSLGQTAYIVVMSRRHARLVRHLTAQPQSLRPAYMVGGGRMWTPERGWVGDPPSAMCRAMPTRPCPWGWGEECPPDRCVRGLVGDPPGGGVPGRAHES